MIISFIGHSFVPSQDTVKLFVKEQIENSISGVGDVTFYLGGYGGAYKSLRYAKRKNKKIINICDYL